MMNETVNSSEGRTPIGGLWAAYEKLYNTSKKERSALRMDGETIEENRHSLDALLPATSTGTGKDGGAACEFILQECPGPDACASAVHRRSADGTA
jgi:hypothetical protein